MGIRSLVAMLLIVGAPLAMTALSRPDQANAAKVVHGLPPATAEHPSECSRFHNRAKWRRIARAQRRGDRGSRRKAARRARKLRRKHDRCHQVLRKAERLRGEHTVSEQYFGTTVGFLRDSRVDPHPLLRSIRDAGLREARSIRPWHTIERTPPVDGQHTYHWERFDREVGLLASYNLRLYSLLAWGARWASPYPDHPQAWKFAPKREYYDDWAEWAAAMAKRYGRDGTFWTAHPELPYLPIQSYEVWNETNHSLFSFPDTPELYADLYLRTYRKIKQVDPAARVVFTAHSSSGFADWLERAYSAKPALRRVVDVIAIHPYARTPEGGLEKLRVMRAAIDSIAGPGVEIDITEDGMPQWPEWDAVRAHYLSELALSVPRSGCGVSKYTLYTWWTKEVDLFNPEDWFGISDLQGNLRPSGEAFVEATRQMQGLGDQPVPWEPMSIC